MLLSIWNVEPVLTLVGVVDLAVAKPHGRTCNSNCVVQEERPPPGR